MSDERGFLTKTDRKFLNGEHEYTGKSAKQQRYQRREAIAERTRQAFQDFAFLYDVIDEHERSRIFDIAETRADGKVVVNREKAFNFDDAIRDTFAFLYLSLEGPLDEQAGHREYVHSFRTLLTAGVRMAEMDRRPVPKRHTVNVDFEVQVDKWTDVDIDRVIDKVARGEAYQLSRPELRQLLTLFDPETRGSGSPGDWSELTDRVQKRRKELADSDGE